MSEDDSGSTPLLGSIAKGNDYYRFRYFIIIIITSTHSTRRGLDGTNLKKIL
jgi:hypothetical protein